MTDRIFQHGEVIESTYMVRDLLGTGGMGEVYDGYDIRLNRTVAIKTSLPNVSGRLLVEEARALALFSHPAIVQIYWLGTHRATPYIVLERLHGTSLFTEFSRPGRKNMTVDEAIDISLGLADGLALLHRAGIVHRDLKPANIMLAPGNRVVLLDFGLVLGEMQVSTAEACGTPQYMAPETIREEVQAGDRRLIDLYALGAVMYEMLNGSAPFASPDPEVCMRRALTEDAVSLRAARPGIPEPLDDLILALLDRSPARRPQTAEAVAWSLRQIRAQSRPGSDGSVSVLIVDDDDYSIRMLELYVRTLVPNAIIRKAGDGVEGLRLARESVPDLLLLDLHMPRLNGMELAVSLRATHLFDACRIVALSARAEADDIKLLRDLGIADFIPKTPETKGQLATIIHQVQRERSRRGWSRSPDQGPDLR